MFRPNLRPVVCDSVSMLRKHRESLSVCSVGPRAPLRANVINLPNDIVDSCPPLSLDFPHGGHLPHNLTRPTHTSPRQKRERGMQLQCWRIELSLKHG